MAKKIANDKIIEVYEKKGCNVTATCTALGISRKTFYNWKEKDPKLQEGLDGADEAIIDFAESKLLEHIQNDNVNALMFFLRTKGRKRGYVEQVENKVEINSFESLLKQLPDIESE